MRKFTWLVVAMALVALPAMAQVQYGTVSGTAMDAEGQPLPGVAVSLSGPAQQGTRTSVTDTAGRFRFMPVPPGTGYNLKFDLAGFNSLEQSGLVVNIGRDTSVVAQMSLSQFAETITVSAERVVVDTTKSTVDYNVDWSLMDSIPNARWYQDIMEMAPGVVGGNNPQVNGGAMSNNSYMIDGVDTTDPRVQTWGTALVYDSIQEVQLQTAAFQAEYGRATGGILNLITKSGGNNFSFTLRYLKQDPDYSAKRGIEKETGRDKTGGGVTKEARPIATLGGPIIKDALWFYTSYEKRDNSRGYSWYATPEDKLAGILSQGMTSYAGHYISGKLTWQVTPDHNVVAFYNEDPITLTPLMRGWTGQSYNESVERYQFQGGDNSSLQWTGVFSPTFFVEAKYQYHRQELNVGPDSPTWNVEPYIYDYATAYYSGGPWDFYQSNRSRDGLLLTGNYFLDAGTSSHELKAGLEYLGLKPKTGDTYNSLGYYRVRGANPSYYTIYTDQSGPTSKPQDYYAIYLQDRWRLGKLTLNLGVRAESTKIMNNKNREILSFGFGDMIAPRLGFAYDLNGDSIHGSIGRFYQLATNYISDYFQETTTMYSRFNWNATCTPDGRDVWTYNPSCWTMAYTFPWGGAAELDPNVKAAYVDEATIGFDKRLSDQYAGSINLVWREQKKDVDFYDPSGYGYYVVTNTPAAAIRDFPEAGLPNKIMQYQALTFELRKRLGPDGFQFMANYTYYIKNKAWENSWRGVWAGSFTSPEAINKWWYGDLTSKHAFKFGGSYTFPWKTVVGINGWWGSGAVYTPYTYEGASFTSIPLAERGSLKVGREWESDLYAEQSFKVGPVSIAPYITFFNVFNNQQPTARGGNADVTASFKKPTAWQAPRSYQIGIKIEY